MESYLLFLLQTYVIDFIKYYQYFFSCVIILFVIVRFSKNLRLVDIPNNRSFHQTPTPSGGGLAIVSIILCANYADVIEICPEFIVGGFLLALVGLVDDIKPLPVLPRLVSQMIVTGCIVFFLPVNAAVMGIPMILVKAVLFVAGVWFINIYNFMDGIDGLAGGYGNAAAVGFLFCIQGTLQVEDWNLEIYREIIYLTMAFLIFNWSPAKIFMGDTGSTFLGYAFFSLGVRGLIHGNYIMYSFIIIMSFFWIDATITIARRFFRGEKIFRAHKEHAFHKAAAIFGHWKVSCFIIVTTLVWLNPMAKKTVENIQYAPWLTFLATLPVLFIILLFNPGSAVQSENRVIRFFKNRAAHNALSEK
jgi:Fuc2NAc and GlcNAc transferase